MNRILNAALGGIVAGTILLSGCDRPRNEPVVPNPTVPERQEKSTHSDFTHLRSQEEYAKQLQGSFDPESAVLL